MTQDNERRGIAAPDDRPARRDRQADRREPANPTRAQEEIHPPAHGADDDRPWEPPSNLAAPPARPGMTQRWVRVAIRNEADVTNLANSLRAGWQPRRADTVSAGFPVPTIKHGEYAGSIGIHGMVLCEMPTQRVEQRSRYYQEQTAKMTQAVARDLAQEVGHPSMPLVEHNRKSVATTGRQRTPRVGEDTDRPVDVDVSDA